MTEGRPPVRPPAAHGSQGTPFFILAKQEFANAAGLLGGLLGPRDPASNRVVQKLFHLLGRLPCHFSLLAP